MATINLASKYEKKLDERFTLGSYTDRYTGSSYNWDGVSTINVWTINTGDLTDYTASGMQRFGTPTEVTDELNSYTVTKKRSFSATIDVTNNQDQMLIKKSSSYLKQMWDEKYIPEIDKYRFKTWADGAGLGTVGSALTKNSIVKAVLDAKVAMLDAGVPESGLVCFIRSDVGVTLALSSELANNQNWTDKTLVKGKIAEIDGMNVISVPKTRLPDGVAFMIKYKNATADPQKLRMLRSHDNTPGIAGVLMEGLCRYDSFVLAQKADGIYVYGDNAEKVVAAPTQAAGIGNAVTLSTTTSGASIKYTLDGSNPKTSSTAQVGTSATVPAGTKLRAYAYKDGMVSSAILSYEK